MGRARPASRGGRAGAGRRGHEDGERAAGPARRTRGAGPRRPRQDGRAKPPSRIAGLAPPPMKREEWRRTSRAKAVADQAERQARFASTSDIEIADVYAAEDLSGWDADA